MGGGGGHSRKLHVHKSLFRVNIPQTFSYVVNIPQTFSRVVNIPGTSSRVVSIRAEIFMTWKDLSVCSSKKKSETE